MGRGVKEMICPALHAEAASKGKRIVFRRDGEKRATHLLADPLDIGTSTLFLMPWQHSMIPSLERYFRTFIVPAGVKMMVNGKLVTRRADAPDHGLADDRDVPRWPVGAAQTRHGDRIVSDEARRRGSMLRDGHPGLPNGMDGQLPRQHPLQRVPMNPNRDAVMTGYLKKIHQACLPALLDEMNADQVNTEWVGEAGVHADGAIQKTIVTKAFGEHAVRAVPAFGRRDANDEAEAQGHTVVRTAHLPEGSAS